MKILFEDKDLEELWLTGNNRKYRKYAQDKKFMQQLYHLFRDLTYAENTSKLVQYSYMDFEKLKYVENRYSVKVMNGRVERVIFRKVNTGIVIEIISLNNDHYASLR